MKDAVNTVNIDERKRISVHYDENPESPLEGLENVSVFVVKQNSNYKYPEAGKNTYDNALMESSDKDALLKKLGITYRRADVRCYRDWVGEYIFYLEKPATDEAFLEGIVQDYCNFANGEVYMLAYEELVTWTDSHGRKKDEWEVADHISGFYLDPYDEEDVLFHARQHFKMEEDVPSNKDEWIALLKKTYPDAVYREDFSFKSKINNASVSLFAHFLSFYASGLTFRLDYEDVKEVEPAKGAYRTTLVYTRRNGAITFTL